MYTVSMVRILVLNFVYLRMQGRRDASKLKWANEQKKLKVAATVLQAAWRAKIDRRFAEQRLKNIMRVSEVNTTKLWT